MASVSSIVTAGSDDSSVGTQAWTSPGNITAADNAWATASLLQSVETHYLKGLMSTPFAVPTGATINGIEVAISRNQQLGAGSIRDNKCHLVKAGVIGSYGPTLDSSIWHSATDTTYTYGGPTDLWGDTWTVADVNDTAFGVVMTARNASLASTDTARVDEITITVYYTAAPLSCALTGTVTTNGVCRESDIVAGGKTIILTLTSDTWVASGATFDAIRQDIIDGLDSAQAESAGWDAEVKAKIGVSDVVRTSDTVVTITLDAEADYDITVQETITATVPGSALTGGSPVVATPTFRVVPDIPRDPGLLGGLGVGGKHIQRKFGSPRRAIVPGWRRR